jgi:tripartite-type tricarboxylate transporter receptor subunit TctC
MTDVSSRLLADKMKKIVGQPIAVVNRTGGGGLVGIEAFLRKKTDPHTLCVLVTAHANASPFVGKEPLDLGQFSYVGAYSPQERILFAQMDAPYKTFEEFVAYAKGHELSFGAGNCLWSLEVVKSIAVIEKLKMSFVNFRSGADCSSNILGGHVNVAETGVGTPAYQAARQGKLRILADLGGGTIPYFPDIPNIVDKGYPYFCTIEFGMLLHAGVPEEIRQYWENTLKRVMEDPLLLKKFLDLGLVPRFLPGREWEKVVKRDVRMAYELLEHNKGYGK